uniref:CUB domain-containing protein n=1 Tax=Meloidogyne floridensis TaxID=298350 RepID=A0A915PEV5_9BILA
MIKFNLILILLLLLIITNFTQSAESDNDCSCPIEEIFDSNWKEGVITSPGFPIKYCGSLDCKWNIQPAENSFIYAKLESFATEERYDTLDVYQTRWNGSELIKLKQASLSGKRYDNPVDHLRFSSSINGGLLFHFITDGSTHNLGFRISFSRGSNDGSFYHVPCPQPFYFATNYSQRLPAFRLRFMDACVFTINSTKAIKLTINRVNKDSKFELEVFETENFPKRYLVHQAGQLAKIERYSTFNSYPLTVKITTKSVSVLITSHDMDNNVDVPYEIEYVAVKPCKCFPNNLTLCRIHPLNLLSPGFPEYCDNLNCSTQISLENPVNTSAYVESLQIQFNTFQTKLGDVIHLKMPYEKRELIPLDKSNGVGNQMEFNVSKVSTFFKRDASVNVWYHREPDKWIYSPNIPRQINFTYEWKELHDKYCEFLDCKWHIQPEENTFIEALLTSFETQKIFDTLDVYHTRMNGSKLIKVQQASLSGERRAEHFHFLSSINGGLYFHFVKYSIKQNRIGFGIDFARKSEDTSSYFFPCPQPFYFATNTPQRLPAFSLRFMNSCIFSINSTQEIKLTINHVNMSSKFGLKVFETESFPIDYLEHQGGQLAKIEKYSFFNSYPLNVTSRTESVSILITSYDYDDNLVVPYEIEFVAAEMVQNDDFRPTHQYCFCKIYLFILFLIIGILILYIARFSNLTINNRLSIFKNIWPRWTRISNKNEGEDGGEARNQLLGSFTSVGFTRNKNSEQAETLDDNNKLNSFSTNNPSYNE